MRRRRFLQWGAVSALQLYVQGCRRGVSPDPLTPSEGSQRVGFGPLVDAGRGLLDLPSGFRYVVLEAGGDRMDDGHKMPWQPDGMACFAGQDGRWVLLRNHELGDGDFLGSYGLDGIPYEGGEVPSPRVDPECFGGVSRLVVDSSRLRVDLEEKSGGRSSARVASHMALAGTDKNCAGGVVPEGWISCEESSAPGHGYNTARRSADRRPRNPHGTPIAHKTPLLPLARRPRR